MLSDGAAPRGIELPNASGRYLATLMGLGLVVGLAVIAYNCYQERARALLLRGRPVLRRPEVVVTNVVALILMANALLCGLGALRVVGLCERALAGPHEFTRHGMRMPQA